MAESELAMIERHIRHGEAIVQRQTVLLAGLIACKYPFDGAARLLQQFRDILEIHRDHRARYRKSHPFDGDERRA
jgi:hypothetical protein